MIESYSDAFHTKRHRKHTKRHMMVCAELTTPNPSSETGSEDLAIIGRRWSLTPSPMLHACQIHGDFVHQAPGHLHLTSSSWPFEMWRMDVIGPINPPTSRGHRFILAIMDYFSKWVKVVPLKEIKIPNVIKLINITCSIASVYPDESSTTMDPNSLAKHSGDSVTNSESKVCC